MLKSADQTVATVVLLFSDLLALLTVPSVLGQRRGRAAAAMSWLLALFAIPYLGALCWWLFGRSHLERQTRARRASHAVYSGQTERPAGSAGPLFTGLLPNGDTDRPSPTLGNQVQLLVDGHQAFPAMEEAIRRAQREIHLLFYIWKGDVTGTRLRDLLIERARAGVTVRLLLDGWGTLRLRPRFLAPLRAAGGRVGIFLPVRPWNLSAFNFRNHRKLVVIDGEEAFTGGMNVGRDYEVQWHDLVARIRGPAVAQLQDVFLDDWFHATGELLEAAPVIETPGSVGAAVLASGPDQWDNHVHDTLFLTISQARDRVWLMTPYFVPGSSILAALRAAAQRGVDVQLLVPKRADVALARLASRALYPILAEAGVSIYEYHGMLHGKALLVDRDLSLIGSANTDNRSFKLNFELSCLFRSEALARELERVFQLDRAHSTLLDREDAQKEPRLDAVLGSVAQLVSPLL